MNVLITEVGKNGILINKPGKLEEDFNLGKNPEKIKDFSLKDRDSNGTAKIL